MKKYTSRGIATLAIAVTALGAGAFIHACKKSSPATQATQSANTELQITKTSVAQPLQQSAPQMKAATILDMSTRSDGSVHVIFRELAQGFTASDPVVISALKKAFESKDVISIVFNPWAGVVTRVGTVSENVRGALAQQEVVYTPGASHSVNLAVAKDGDLNDPSGLGILNTTTTGLTNVIPDWATAQQMFDYIAHQCCALPGPYGVDHCISFQYCPDGCYARAHKMCWVINNMYHYATHKIFSFAYPSTYTLSVQAQKWGGCCINWWYHVAPLVNIQTPSGIRAYVFDPAMFDQPVLLATWLHAQENPACTTSDIPKVTSFNIQPTSSYSPMDTAHFGTDPTYSSTNMTLISYAPLKTCP